MNNKISQQQKINSLKKQVKAMTKAIQELELIEKDNQTLDLIVKTIHHQFESVEIEKQITPKNNLEPSSIQYILTLQKENSPVNEENYVEFFANCLHSQFVSMESNSFLYPNAFQVHVSLDFKNKILTHFQKNKTPHILIKVVENHKIDEILDINEKEKLNALYDKLKLDSTITNFNHSQTNIKQKI
jgi:hypothetical protein